MAQVIRLTESELTRLIKKIVMEAESEKEEMPHMKEKSGNASCSTELKRFFNKVQDVLTFDEIDAIVNEYEITGEEGLEDAVEDTLVNEPTVKESRGGGSLKSAIKKINKIILMTSGGWAFASGLIACLDWTGEEKIPNWVGNLFEGGIMVGLPLAFVSLIIAKGIAESEGEEI